MVGGWIGERERRGEEGRGESLTDQRFSSRVAAVERSRGRNTSRGEFDREGGAKLTPWQTRRLGNPLSELSPRPASLTAVMRGGRGGPDAGTRKVRTGGGGGLEGGGGGFQKQGCARSGQVDRRGWRGGGGVVGGGGGGWGRGWSRSSDAQGQDREGLERWQDAECGE